MSTEEEGDLDFSERRYISVALRRSVVSRPSLLNIHFCKEPYMSLSPGSCPTPPSSTRCPTYLNTDLTVKILRSCSTPNKSKTSKTCSRKSGEPPVRCNTSNIFIRHLGMYQHNIFYCYRRRNRQPSYEFSKWKKLFLCPMAHRVEHRTWTSWFELSKTND